MIERFRSRQKRMSTHYSGAIRIKAGLHFGNDIHKAARRRHEGRREERRPSCLLRAALWIISIGDNINVKIKHRSAAFRFAAVFSLLACAARTLPRGARAPPQSEEIRLTN